MAETNLTKFRKMEEKKTAATKKQQTSLQDDTEMVIESSEDLEVVKSFDDIGLREELLRGKFNLLRQILNRNLRLRL